MLSVVGKRFVYWNKAGSEGFLTRHRDLQQSNSGQRGKEREKNREEARKKKRIKELGLWRDWDKERTCTGEEQRKKGEKK